MAILKEAQLQDRKRLLELFPLAAIKERWPEVKGTKEEVCFSVAGQASEAEIIEFVLNNLPRCKQHVYILNRPHELNALPEAVIGGERVHFAENNALYIIWTSYSVVLKDPLEETELGFFWPVHVQFTPNHVIVRFVALEKNVSSYFERQCYVVRRSIEEKTILGDLGFSNLERTDIHGGIKALWDNGFMDSPRTTYKKPMSLASEAMDEARGIREHNPELYELLADSVLLNTLFMIPEGQGCGVSAFSADCVNGYLAFPRYSERDRGTDFVIGEILRLNQ
ncbi:MAG: hypothetical protein L0338_31230 [Acidobacteria bacterium]|nr:hypothetical protein [Acidobacteriota bacterium]